MRRRFSQTTFSRFFLFAILIAPLSAAAQIPDIYVTPIPNAPFSGVVHVERSVVQRDGSVVTFKTIRDIHRDSRGRIYNEGRTLRPLSDTETPKLMHIHLYDPQTRISTMLYPQQGIFWTTIVNSPPMTVPPAFFDASTTGRSLPLNEFAKEEDLGTKNIDGLSVHGVRHTQTIAPGNGDTGKQITVADEIWYSEDLRINLVIKHSDPRTGAVTMTVTQVTRKEPDPALFEIPEGYRPAGAARGTNP
jgi:hypothetical protein